MNIQLRDEEIVKYLLGEMSEQGAGRFEQECFADGDLLDQVAAIREELMVDYLNGHLPEPRRERFEQYFLDSPKHREMLDETRVVLTALTPRPAASPEKIVAELERRSWPQALMEFFTGRNRVLGWAMAVALVVCFAGLWLVSSQLRKSREDLRQARQQATRHQAEIAALDRQRQDLESGLASERERADQLTNELAHARRQPGSGSATQNPDLAQDLMASVTLISDLDGGATKSGGGEPRKLALAPDDRSVRLELKLAGNNYADYRVTISQTSSGRQVFRQAGLKARPAASVRLVKVVLPASLFAANVKDYLVKLEGRATGGAYVEADSYSFRIERK